MGALGGLVKPAADAAQKAVRAANVKKVSLKVKLKVKKGDKPEK